MYVAHGVQSFDERMTRRLVGAAKLFVQSTRRRQLDPSEAINRLLRIVSEAAVRPPVFRGVLPRLADQFGIAGAPCRLDSARVPSFRQQIGVRDCAVLHALLYKQPVGEEVQRFPARWQNRYLKVRLHARRKASRQPHRSRCSNDLCAAVVLK